MRPNQIIKYSLITLGSAIGLFAFAFAYQVITAGEMKFEVPRDFRGLVILKPDSGGQNPREWLKIPTTGIIKVSNFKPYSNYYTVKAKWEDGEKLEVVSSGRTEIERLSFWTLPLRGDSKAFYFFVGTRGELKKIWSDEFRKKLYSSVPT